MEKMKGNWVVSIMENRNVNIVTEAPKRVFLPRIPIRTLHTLYIKKIAI